MPLRFAATFIVVLLAVSSVARPAQAAFTLGVRLDVPMSAAQPQVVVSADLNGDGNPDLVTSNINVLFGNSISVFLGDGHGGFGPRTDFPTGLYPAQVSIGDVNNDGRLDAVTVNYHGSSISVLLGNGAGGFGPKTDYPVNPNPSHVALGDLNGDGRNDVVVTSWATGSTVVSVMLGTPAGTFGPRTDVSVMGTSNTIALGDYNGDGRLDLATPNTNVNSVSVRLGNGDGTFGPIADFPLGAGALWLTSSDLNNDGKLDLVASNVTTNMVSVLMGAGDGTFAPKVDYATGSSPVNVAVGDVDGDGIPDLVSANSGAGTNSVSVLVGTGTGAFGTRTDFAAAPQTFCPLLVDVNGDGSMDIVASGISGTAGSSLSMLLGNGAGGFGPKTDDAVGASPAFVAAGDLNGDGRPDLAVANNGSITVSVLLADGAGGFGARTDFQTGNGPRSVALADVNSDGKADLVAACLGANLVSVLPGNGAGGFGPRFDYPTGSGAFLLAMGDVNGDGKPDLAVPNQYDGTVSVLLNDGLGAFSVRTDFVVGTGPRSAAIADLNGDGRPDLAVTNFGSSTVSILLGDGLGGFGAKSDFATGAYPFSLVTGDANGDGHPDLEVANFLNSSVSVLANDGAGGFGSRSDFAVGFNPVEVAFGDLNGDGRPDIATSNSASQNVSVLLGDGSGGFGPQKAYPTGVNSQSVAIADLNGDGRRDLAVANSGSGTLSVLLALTPTRLSVSASPGTAVLGAPLTLTANVAVPAPGRGSPGGTVRFYDGATLLGSAPVNTGVAALAIVAPRPGVRSLIAVYSGDGRYSASFSPATSLRVVATPSPAIAAIADVKGDQGGSMRIRFRASPFDYVGSVTPITQYEVYRRVAPGLAPARAGFASVRPDARAPRPANVLLDGWDLVATSAAHTDSVYSLVVPTLADSNASGVHRATFLVRAATSSPSQYYDSAADSAYSVDNLPPAPPSGFAGAYANGATQLHWNGGAEPDLWYYRVYRGKNPAFAPGSATWIANVSADAYVDAAGSPYFYKLSAVDANGNESGFATLQPGGTAGVDDGIPVSFALAGVTPNPSTGGRLSVSFVLPDGMPATLELLDVTGRRVASREVGTPGAGRHVVELSPRGHVAPGLYLVRLAQAGRVRVARVSVIE